MKRWPDESGLIHQRRELCSTTVYLPEYSTLLSGRTPPDEVGFQSSHLQIWYNHTGASWVGEDERPHKQLHSDECFIVLHGSLVVEVDGRRFSIGPREFCCFPAGQYHAVVAVHPPVETLMMRAPSVDDKVYQEQPSDPAPIRPATAVDLPVLYALDQIAQSDAARRAFIARSVGEGRAWVVDLARQVSGYSVIRHDFFGRSFLELVYITADRRASDLQESQASSHSSTPLPGSVRPPPVFTALSTMASSGVGGNRYDRLPPSAVLQGRLAASCSRQGGESPVCGPASEVAADESSLVRRMNY